MSGATTISIPSTTVTQSVPTTTPVQLSSVTLSTFHCPKRVRICKRDRDLFRLRTISTQLLLNGTVNVSPVTNDTYGEISKCCGSAKIWAYPELCTAWCEPVEQTLAQLNACFWLPTRRGLKPGLTTVTCNGSPSDCGDINAPGNTTTIWIPYNMATAISSNTASHADATSTLTSPAPTTASAKSTGSSRSAIKVTTAMVSIVSIVWMFLPDLLDGVLVG